MSNSETLFMGLIIVLFGYYGWLLWQVYTKLKELGGYKSELAKLINNQEKLNNIKREVFAIKEELGEMKKDIIIEVKDESDEIKEIVKILMGQSRTKKKKSTFLSNENNLEDKVIDGEKKEKN